MDWKAPPSNISQATPEIRKILKFKMIDCFFHYHKPIIAYKEQTVNDFFKTISFVQNSALCQE